MDRINKFLFAILTSIVIVSIISCGLSFKKYKETKIYKPRFSPINMRIRPYVNEYITTMQKAGIKVPIGKDLFCVDFTPSLNDDTLGIAWGMDVDNITFVQINEDNWMYLSVQQKRLLIFHELSHDIFNLKHFDTTVMNTPIPSIFATTKVYVDNVIDELINHIKSKDEQ